MWRMPRRPPSPALPPQTARGKGASPVLVASLRALGWPLQSAQADFVICQPRFQPPQRGRGPTAEFGPQRGLLRRSKTTSSATIM
jgi:hypothetical protein